MTQKKFSNKKIISPLILSMNFKVIFAFLFISTHWGYSQNSPVFHIPDSLKNKTYDELYQNYIVSYNDTINEKIYAKAYLHKAKNNNDTIKIASGYAQFARIVSSYNAKLALIYTDSIIDLTKNLNNHEYPGFGYMLKGAIYYNFGDYKKALNQYLVANQYASKNNNLKQIIYIKISIGRLKNFWGNYSEALVLFKSIIVQLDQLDATEFSNKNSIYLTTLYGITNSYIFAKKYDSAFIYAEIGLQRSLKGSPRYYNFISQTGIIAYYQHNFKMALDNLDKALPYETSPNGLLNDHFYRGNIYWEQRQNKKAFYHFSKADSIYNATNDVVPEVRDIQEYFVIYYKNKNDIKNQLKYINRLLKVDSIIAITNRNINETLVKKYDTPLLLSEKEKIISDLKKKEQKSSFAIIGLIGLVSLIILFFIRYYLKQRVLKVRFNKLLLNKEKETIKEAQKKSSNKISGVSEKIITSVLKALVEFEANNGFLDNNLTLNSLSKSINTNSNYLSKIINHYKNKNFSTYISDLRIDYCIQQLKTDANCRKYTISDIALEIGFNNDESFSKAFFKKTGLYPSYFIKELEKKTSQ